MESCERCKELVDTAVDEDGILLCEICCRQMEYDRHCDFLHDQRAERDDNEGPFDYEPKDLELQIREGSIE